MNKTLGVVLVVILVIATAGAYLFPKVQVPLGANPGPDHYELQQFFGGLVRGNYVATTSQTAAATLKVSDIAERDVIAVQSVLGATDVTYTFFASSSARSWLPQAGMTQQTCFLNATTSTSVNLIFAGGLGIDLQVASSTGTLAKDVTIGANATACFTFIRKAATAASFDIEANLVEYGDAD